MNARAPLFFCIGIWLCVGRLLGALPADYVPEALYLTWTEDPTTTMTVQWISKSADEDDVVSYRKEKAPVAPQPAETAAEKEAPETAAEKEVPWNSLQGAHHPLPEGHPYLVHVAEITKLEPDTTYQFRLDGSDTIYRFRTMPASLDTPITFCVGGDTYHKEPDLYPKTCYQAAHQNPRFVLLGGDLAYATPDKESLPEDATRWLEWLAIWTEIMHTSDGLLIPMLPAIGNHEVKGRYDQTPAQAPFFYALFAMPGPAGYSILRFDSYLSIAFLDSNHTHPISGAQTQWLQSVLAKQGDVLHRFAIYHVPAYPSVRDFRLYENSSIRRNWVPLFEKYGVQIVFENHDHSYKRTWPLIEGSVSPHGVVYIGDGSWGVKPRQPKDPTRTTYLAKTVAATQFTKVEISKKKREFWAITDEGRIIDHYIQYTDAPCDLSEEKS